MQRGFVFSTEDNEQVLCFTKDKTNLCLKPVDSSLVLNKAVCLHDLTEAKNIFNRFKNHYEVMNYLQIVNIARLYKKFF